MLLNGQDLFQEQLLEARLVPVGPAQAQLGDELHEIAVRVLLDGMVQYPDCPASFFGAISLGSMRALW